jgi:dihydrolipoamide dehydrogenase
VNLNTESGQYDVAVLGSGPGGYVAAIRGKQLGLRVALVEKYEKFGGTCLHWGCVPTKALLLNAELYEKALRAKEYGIVYKDLALDYGFVKARKDKIVKKLSMGVDFLMKKNKVDTFHGKGRLAGPGIVQIEGEQPSEIRADKIILATGSEAKVFPGISPDGHSILTNKDILDLESIPKSLLIIGGGAVGVEFATIFSRFGTQVTIVEMLPRILPLEDSEISEEIRKLLAKKKIRILVQSRLEDLRTEEGNVHARISGTDGSAQDIVAEKALIAVGRQPVIEDLGLEKARVSTSRGFITVNEYMQTSAPGVYAIGDVVPTQALAHLASHEGMLAMDHIAKGSGVPINYDLVPSCTYCSPEVASVGLTEDKARDRGFEVVTGRFPFAAVSKATILGENEGFVKMICEKRHLQILGIHMIGPKVTEMISGCAAMIGLEATAADISHLIHPHPTLSEGIMETAHSLYSGAAIHI